MLALGYGRKVELRQLSELLGTVHAAKPKHVLPLRVLSQRGDDLECSGHGRAQANSNEKSPFSSLTAMAPSGQPSTVRARYSSLIRGRTVLEAPSDKPPASELKPDAGVEAVGREVVAPEHGLVEEGGQSAFEPSP
jgi:hypothetical protein